MQKPWWKGHQYTYTHWQKWPKNCSWPVTAEPDPGVGGCHKIRNLIVSSANIQLYYSKIGKSARKGVFWCNFPIFCSLFDVVSILALQTTKFIFSMNFLIFRHPTHPWVHFSSKDTVHELFSLISCHNDSCWV